MVKPSETRTNKIQTPIARKSIALNLRAEYQLRLSFFPKPRSSMALEMVSIRSMEDRIRGIRIALATFSR